MNKYLEEGDSVRGRDPRRHSGGHFGRVADSGVLRYVHSRTRACRPMLDAVIQLLPSPADRPPVKGVDESEREASRAGGRRSAVLCARLQDHDRSVCRVADVFPGVFRNAELGRCGLQPGQVEEGADWAHPADARQRAAGAEGGARGRYSCSGRSEGRHHRRHALRPGPRDHAGADGFSGARDRDGGRAEDQGRSGKDGYCAWSAGGRGSVVSRAYRRGVGADDHRRHG